MEEKKWLEEFVEGAQRFCKGFRVRMKEDSWWMRMIGRLMFWNDGFMDCLTRSGRTVYLPKGAVDIGSMGHELRHAVDGFRNTNLLVGIVYYFPQWIGLLSLLSLVAIWGGGGWLWWLVCLVCLLPIPSPGRMMMERRGYLVSLLVVYWKYGREIALSKVDEVLDLLSGKEYYWAWPFRSGLRSWFEMSLPAGSEYPDDEVLVWLKEFVRSHPKIF